jgi:hypothetical protein
MICAVKSIYSAERNIVRGGALCRSMSPNFNVPKIKC